MKYYCIKQHDMTDCGAACIATISKQYGLKIPITKIREAAGTDKQGTNILGMLKALEQLGFTAKAVKGDQKAFFSEFPLPAVAHVIIDKKLLHYVVIHKITKKQVIIADPAKGIVKYTPEEFFQIWTGILILTVPSNDFKKGDKTKGQGVFSRFVRLLIPQKRLLINIFFASLLYTILGIGASFYFQFLMDDIIPNTLEQTLNILSIEIILLYLFQTLLGAFRSQLLLYLSQRLDIALDLGYYKHVLKLPMNFFSTRKVGEIISRFMDASKIRDAISGATLSIMIDTLMALAGAIILYIQNSSLFAIAFIILTIYAIIVFIFNKPLKKVNRDSMENNSQLTSYLVESLNGIETVKSFNFERGANLETEKRFVKLMRSIFKNGWLNNISNSLSNFISMVGGIVILWVGVYQVIQGKLTIGGLLTFNALLGYFLNPVKNLINLQPMMQTAVVAADRLGEILDLETEKGENEEKKMNIQSLKGPIEFKEVDFRYGTRKQVLNNINLTIKPGEKIALVGESGSGKTTLAKLLLRFYNCENGNILINNYNIQDINIETLRERIAYIPQNIFLFSGTIYENLTLGMQNPNMENVIRACQMAKAHDFINTLPQRYETMIGENGSDLSGGQKQRIAIARALLKNPDILIMDEATSNLDSITEKAIENTISQNTTGITAIIIAHRLSTIMRCNKIYVIEHGKIVESGTHEDLINLRGFYYNLWKEQLPDRDTTFLQLQQEK